MATMNSKEIFALILVLLLTVYDCQSTQPILALNLTYAATSSFGIQAPYDYNWVDVFPESPTSKLRQTILDKQGTGNKIQYELEIDGSVQPLAIASINHTCVLLKHKPEGLLVSYKLDPITQTVSMFNDEISSIPGMSSLNLDEAEFKITQNCKALKINNKIYHYNSITQVYVQDTLPFTITDKTAIEDELTMLVHNGSIYNFNWTTNQYELERRDSLYRDTVSITRCDIYNSRVLIYSAQVNQTSNKLFFKFSINQFQNGQLVQLREIKDFTFSESFLVNDRSLSRFVYTIIIPTSSGQSDVQIKGAYANYKTNKVTALQIPQQFYTFNGAPFVLFTEKYLYIRELQSEAPTLRQLVYQFLGSKFNLIAQNAIQKDANVGFKRVVLEDKNTQVSIYSQFSSQEFMYMIYEVVIEKQNTVPVIPNTPDPNLFSFAVPSGVTLIRSAVYPKWMYFDFETPVTNVKGLIFVMGETDNKVTIQESLTGNWQILGGTDITMNCAVLLNTLSPGVKVFYYNQATRESELKADVGVLFAAQNVINPANFVIDVSDQCQFLRIGDSIYHHDGTLYRNVTVPDGWTAPTLDETFKVAIYDGWVWQYSANQNRYYGTWNGGPQTGVYQQKQEVFLNGNKLIILSSETVLSTSPVSYNYRVHYLVSNGSNWNPVDVRMSGSTIIAPPKIQISPDYETFGIGGIDTTGTPFIQGRVLDVRDTSVQGTSRDIKIPSDMIYNNQIPFVRLSNRYLYYRRLPTESDPIVQNHEAFYQIDRQNGLLKFINKRNLTAAEQSVWRNTFIIQVNNSMGVLYESLVDNTVKLTQRIVGNANGGGSPTANVAQSDTGSLMAGNVTFMCPTGCSSCLTVGTCEICSEGFALIAASSKCRRCKGSCKTCSANDHSVCTSCFPGSFLSEGSCPRCDNSCIQCETTAATCTVCRPGKILSMAGVCQDCPLSNCVSCEDASTCLKCRPGFVVDANDVCVPCTSSCSECDPENVLTCLNCRAGFQLSTTGKCVRCPQNCKECVNGVCSECRNDFRLTSTGNCAKKCQFPCMGCSDSDPQSCTSCSGEYTLNAAKCIPKTACNQTASCEVCAVGFVLWNGNCLPCQAGNTCKQCDLQDPALCVSCVNGFYLDSSSVCINCPQQCTTCQYAQSCTGCIDGFTLSGDSTASQCLACESPCLTCSQSTTNCLSCVSGFKKQGWRCKKNINIGFVFKFNIAYVSITTLQVLNVVNDIATLLGILPSQVTLSDSYQGSAVMVGDVALDTGAQVDAGLSALAAVGAGSLGGLTVESSQFTGNYDASQQDENNARTLTIVLAVVIPIVVVTAIVLVIILFKKGVIFAKAGISQSIELQSLDNINPMNLKELKFNNQFRQVQPNSLGQVQPNYSTLNFE